MPKLVLTAEHLGEKIATQSAQQRALLRMCLEQKWKCHWCSTIMCWGKRTGGGKLTKDQATIDHVYDRFDPRRVGGGSQPKVAACHGCNDRRGRERTQTVPKELQQIPWHKRRQIFCQEVAA